MPRRLHAQELEARLREALFASPSQRSAKNIADGLEKLSRDEQEQVLRWVGVAAQTHAEVGFLVASLAPRACARLDAEGFAAWVLDALDVHDRAGTPEALARLRALDAFCVARNCPPAVARFSEVAPAVARLLQGLAGRPLALGVAPRAYTDTETVFLPAELGWAASAAANCRLYKMLAVMLWAQAHHGTFGSAELDPGAALARWADRERALRWFAALEAVRLEARIGADLPGMAREIAVLRGPWPDALRAAASRLGRADATLADTLALLAENMARAGEAPVLVHAGSIDPDAALAVRAARLAREADILNRAPTGLKGFGARAGEGAPTPGANSDSGPAAGRADAEAAALSSEAEAATHSLRVALDGLPPASQMPAGPGAWRPTGASDADEPAATPPGAFAARYDEWDYRRGAYRRQWCHLFEVALEARDGAYVDEVRTRRAAAIRGLRRRFEALRGEVRRLGRQPEGEEIDLDALVEARADRLTGRAPEARLYRRQVRVERSLAAMFMVDMSGSTKGWVNDAEREALVMLCEALESLGDACAIYGFSGWARTRCEVYPVKRFGERYDAAVRGRIAAIEARDYTRMGGAVRHLSRLLEAQPARHRLLVTLSDGRPDDFGDEYRGHYGIEDTRRALQEAHSRGVRAYCITIDRHGADYLPRLYGPAGYTVLDDAASLPLKVADIYRRLVS